MVLSMDFPVWSYGYMLTPQVAIPVLFLATSLMKWNQFSIFAGLQLASNVIDE